MYIFLPHIILNISYFALGSILGSFANVLIFRHPAVPASTGLPALASAVAGRSQCPHCKHQLSAADLVPIFSFIFLRGECRYCRAKISPQYPLVELVAGISGLIILVPLMTAGLGGAMAAILNLAIVITLIVLFVIDLRTMLLPDIYVLLLGAFVAVRLLTTNYQLLTTATLGALIGAGLLGLLWLITRGRGLGLGDVKLMIPLGALFGHIDTALLLLVAFIAGGAVAAGLLISKKVTMKTAVPFGPFLAGTAILFILWPELPMLLTTLLFGNSIII